MTSEEHKDLASIWEAVAVVQAKAPPIAKTEMVDTTKEGGKIKYAFAGLNTVWEAIATLMDDLGLVWSCLPDVLDLGGGQTRFVLRYTLMHLPTGQSLTGCYPLAGDTPQKIGSGMTYGRRYGLVAVLNLRVVNDDDDAQRTVEQGDLTPSQQIQAARPRKAAATRTPARPRSAPAPIEEAPVPANPAGPMSEKTRKKMFAAMGDLGHSTREEYGEYINRILAKHGAPPVGSSTELTQEQAGWVIEAAEAALAGPPPETTGDDSAPAGDEG